MATSRGKDFEKKFEADWVKAFPDGFYLRLPDQQSGYFGTSRNLCDSIAFCRGTLFVHELKSIKGNTFPFSNLTQLEKLTNASKCKDVRVGVTIWFIEHSRVIYVDIKTVNKMIEDGKKSVNIRLLEKEEYSYIEIPSIQKRVFLDSDYTVLFQ